MVKIETKAVISVQKEDRVHEYLCMHTTNLGEIFDVLSEMQAMIIEKMKEALPKKQKDEAIDGSQQQ